MDELIIKKLLEFRDKLKKEYKDFPYEYCQISSRKIEECFGFEQVFGIFIDDNEIGHDHHWNCSNGEIIDLTADQFSKKFPEVYILKEDSYEAEKYYLKGVYFMI